MCVHYNLDNGYLIYDKKRKILIAMKYFVVKQHALWGWNMTQNKYNAVLEAKRHWLHVLPSITQQDVEYLYHHHAITPDYKQVEKHSKIKQQTEWFTRKLELGYHAEAFREDPWDIHQRRHLQDVMEFNDLAPLKYHICTPIMFFQDELMCLDKDDVVVREFRIPDPEHFQTLYMTAFSLFSVADKNRKRVFKETSKALKSVFKYAPKK